jgi:hypothetical protein
MPTSHPSIPHGFIVLPSGLIVPGAKRLTLAAEGRSVDANSPATATDANKIFFHFPAPTARGRC